jgi:hypothetical protein
MNPKNHARAVRYRKLALTEPDEARATLLLTIAEEAERDVLFLGYARRDEQGLPTQSQKLPIQTYTGH